jgi:hypothetical protein
MIKVSPTHVILNLYIECTSRAGLLDLKLGLGHTNHLNYDIANLHLLLKQLELSLHKDDS